jgi:hypothetical protein
MAIRFGAGVIFGDVTPGSTTTQKTLGLGVSLVQQAQAQASTPTGSVQFNGSTQYLTVADNTAFAFGSGNFTIECWFYQTSTARADILSKGNSATFCPWVLQINGTNLNFYVSDNGGSYAVQLSSSVTYAQNTWNHAAAVRNGNTITLYLNGVSVASTSYSGTPVTNAQTVGIGGDSSGTYKLTGYLSNARVVKGTALYTANFTPSTVPLTAIANTVLLTAQSSTTITDASTNAFAITNTGTAVAVTANPFVGGSASFNGSSQYLTMPNSAGFAFGTGDFTVEAWVYTPAPTNGGVTTDRTIFGGFTQTPGEFFFLDNTANKPSLYNGTVGTYSTIGVSANTWTHVAWVRYNSTLTIYVNGVSGVSVPSYTTNFTAGTAFYIGKNDTASDRYFSGYISNLRVVKGTAVYTANFTPSTTPLTAIAGTSLLTAQSKTSATTDASSNNFTITNNGSATATGLSPFSIVGTTVTQTYVPDAPNIILTTPTDASLAVTFEPPSFNGGSSVTSFTVSLTGAGVSTSTVVAGSAGATVTFSGLTASTSYRARAYAVNSVGTSTSSYPVDATTAPPTTVTAQYLVVAGGGGSMGGGGGGGGAGGFLCGSATLTPGTAYTILVGGGGPTAYGSPSPGPASNGSPSSLSGGSVSVVATGGGQGAFGYVTGSSGTPGGSGGGGGMDRTTAYPGGTGIAGQGNPGLKGQMNSDLNGSAGSGGGAGGGSSGKVWPYTGSTYAAGGGVGGGAGSSGTGGGGGAGSIQKVGCNSYSINGSAGQGGSGVVILAVPTARYPGSAPGAGVSTPGSAPGMTVLTYTSSGSYTA